jgi:hypothetical protein
MSDSMRSAEHRRYRELLGAYVSGQLEDAEEVAQLRRHLEGCASCQVDEEEMRAVVVLLSAAPAANVEPVEPDPPPNLEDRIVNAVYPDRRRGSWGLVTGSLAAAAAIFVTAIGLTVFLRTEQGPPALGEVEQISFTEAPKGVSTESAVVAHTWGTEVRLEVEGLEPGEVYTVEIEPQEGGSVSAGTFVAVEDKVVECRLNGAVLRQNAQAISVRNAANREVLRSELEPRPDLVSNGPANLSSGGAALDAAAGKPDESVFAHRATSGNVSGNSTYLDKPRQ